MNNIDLTFVQDIINLKNKTKGIMIICYANCLISLFSAITTPKGLNRINVSMFGALSAVIGLSISRIEETLSIKLNELDLTSRATSKELLSTLLKNNEFQVSVPMAPIQEQDIITDVVSYWRQQEKHLAIVGGTGDGKSYTIKHFINTLQDSFSIAAYDVDFAKDDYPDCVNVKFEYADIEQSFIDDMEELEKRIGERRALGKRYVPDKRFIVGEEMPALAEECESLGIWMRKMSKRGRKVGLFVAALSQSDTAENFALKGDYQILKSNFCLLYLGAKAKTRAKQLKNQALIDWLDVPTKGRGLLDDRPCLISANTIVSTSKVNDSTVLVPTNQLLIQEQIISAESSGRLAGSAFLAVEGENQDGDFDDKKLEIARILYAEGYSKNKILKLLWNCEGGRQYSQLARLLDN